MRENPYAEKFRMGIFYAFGSVSETAGSNQCLKSMDFYKYKVLDMESPVWL